MKLKGAFISAWPVVALALVIALPNSSAAHASEIAGSQLLSQAATSSSTIIDFDVSGLLKTDSDGIGLDPFGTALNPSATITAKNAITYKDSGQDLVSEYGEVDVKSPYGGLNPIYLFDPTRQTILISASDGQFKFEEVFDGFYYLPTSSGTPMEYRIRGNLTIKDKFRDSKRTNYPGGAYTIALNDSSSGTLSLDLNAYDDMTGRAIGKASISADLSNEQDGYANLYYGVTPAGGTTSPVSTVPLPASAPLFGAGLLGLASLGYVAKRKKAAAAA